MYVCAIFKIKTKCWFGPYWGKKASIRFFSAIVIIAGVREKNDILSCFVT